jgi:hypothetical protein
MMLSGGLLFMVRPLSLVLVVTASCCWRTLHCESIANGQGTFSTARGQVHVCMVRVHCMATPWLVYDRAGCSGWGLSRGVHYCPDGKLRAALLSWSNVCCVAAAQMRECVTQCCQGKNAIMKKAWEGGYIFSVSEQQNKPVAGAVEQLASQLTVAHLRRYVPSIDHPNAAGSLICTSSRIGSVRAVACSGGAEPVSCSSARAILCVSATMLCSTMV